MMISCWWYDDDDLVMMMILLWWLDEIDDYLVMMRFNCWWWFGDDDLMMMIWFWCWFDCDNLMVMIWWLMMSGSRDEKRNERKRQWSFRIKWEGRGAGLWWRRESLCSARVEWANWIHFTPIWSNLNSNWLNLYLGWGGSRTCQGLIPRCEEIRVWDREGAREKERWR